MYTFICLIVAICYFMPSQRRFKQTLSKLFRRCGAKSTFCGKLKTSKFKTRRGGPSLDERADRNIPKIMGKKLQHSLKNEINLMLAGGGQSSLSISGSSQMLFKRDYPNLVNFDGKSKVGVICVPSQIIPKYGFNLYHDKQQEAIDAAQQAGYERLAKEVRKARRSDIGDIPEENAFNGLKEGLGETLW